VSLVVQAGAIGGRGQVYVLDMGEPVKILDLARNMIRLSGKKPETDIAIAFVGVRPGEKLHEELWTAGETVGVTSHPKILRAARAPIDVEWLDEELTDLERMVERGETLDVVSRLTAMLREPKRAGSAVLEDTLH
jgi:FlaA1/EpsC-like NDP-sugar epimerase